MRASDYGSGDAGRARNCVNSDFEGRDSGLVGDLDRGKLHRAARWAYRPDSGAITYRDRAGELHRIGPAGGRSRRPPTRAPATPSASTPPYPSCPLTADRATAPLLPPCPLPRETV